MASLGALGGAVSPNETSDGDDDRTRSVTPVDATALGLPTLPAEGSPSSNEKQLGNGEPADPHPVDLQGAKEEFHQLARTLTARSHASRRSAPGDVEKGTEEEFDLLAYLTTDTERRDQAGVKRKRVGVVWEGLNVVGVGGAKMHVENFMTAILNSILFIPLFLLKLLHLQRFRPVPKTILHDFNGVLRPGEMCLVLGRPGSGCTTFLKTISNRRGEYLGVGGRVEYAGIGAEEMERQYKGEVVYNQEDDIHLPTLTVHDTLSFALELKMPPARLTGQTRSQLHREIENMLLKMLNIQHTANTLVGNEFVRGVSGGERKRVSIAEMMASRAHVSAWDNSTRGLDASTALDYTKSLRVLTDVLDQTTFVSLYQAGENIYRLFDKVLVIDEGRQVYFGPAKEARQYFISLGFKDFPRQTTADYLTGCTDPNEREYQEDAKSAPHSSAELEEAFRRSKYWANMERDKRDYDEFVKHNGGVTEEFREAVVQNKRGASKKSPYTRSFLGQVKALTARQFKLQLQDRFGLMTSYGTSIVLALVIGSTFLNLPLTAAGGFTRGSVIFLALLLNALDAFGELPTMMLGRPILYKQTTYAFYRSAALPVANTIADIPFSFLRMTLFDIIVYFMAGLKRNPGGFFTFHLINYTGFLSMQGLFRTFGILCPDFDTAFRLGALFVPLTILYSGYLIPVFSMQRWLFWIYYLNPLNYGFQSLLENEMGRIVLDCVGSYVVPNNGLSLNKYPNEVGPNQVCTLPGSVPGQAFVEGSSYVAAAFAMNIGWIWRNFGILILFFAFFQMTQMVSMESKNHASLARAMQLFARESKEDKQLNEELKERRAAIVRGQQKQDISSLVKSKEPFTFEELNYHVPVQGGTKRLLHDVYGYVKPGTLTALMGASGAGKTTCLDVLAQRKNIGVVQGDVLMNGRPLGANFARGTAYAEQMDVHEESATVREALRFSAYLRQEASTPKDEKDRYVEEIIELLEMDDLAEALVAGLGVEARKRLTIGVELASKPQLLLFLDEPTSGLDGQSAWNLVRFLRKLADSGQAILCTIHQPSSLLFESFDRLLLLQRGGETVYCGPIGKDSQHLRDYFAKHGAHCGPTDNPAEFMLEAIGAGTTRRIGSKDWGEIWLESSEYQLLRREIEDIKREALQHPNTEDKPSFYATGLPYQLRLVTQRCLTTLWRRPEYVYSRLFIHLLISFWVSMTFLRLNNSLLDLQYRVFAIFWVTVLPAIVVTQIEPMFILNRMIFIREASSRMYSPYAFAIGQLLAEIPYSFICAVAYFLLMYYPMNFVGNAGYAFAMVLFTELFGVSLGQAIGALSPSIRIAALFNPFIILVLTTFCGVTIPYPTLGSFWRSWLYQLTPFTRLVSGMISNELYNLPIVCRDSEYYVFQPPSGQTCFEWAGDFINEVGGYLANNNATSNCQYCQYRLGQEFYTPLNISYSTRERDLWILFCYFVANFIITVLASRFLRYAKR
ncbi:ABC-transporter [Calocera viscosa TUFC12733]|uniref:ABC-transporter n=1 Tax=Calocera viscosa (strain TUFC12733) TaxID=1330018 RepID=A0A167KBG4_CALVF|nr:ABC-transporter [Calocera viscosa TUFC12733]